MAFPNETSHRGDTHENRHLHLRQTLNLKSMPGCIVLCRRACQAACCFAEEHVRRHVALQQSMPGGMLLFKRATLGNHVAHRFFFETDDGKYGLQTKMMSSKTVNQKISCSPSFFFVAPHHAIDTFEAVHTMRS